MIPETILLSCIIVSCYEVLVIIWRIATKTNEQYAEEERVGTAWCQPQLVCSS
jgi:hypothetical protein